MAKEENVVRWTRPKLERFKKTYDAAVANDEEIFVFDGLDYVPDYAKFLIEFLEGELAR
jgi:hypothetical protein